MIGYDYVDVDIYYATVCRRSRHNRVTYRNNIEYSSLLHDGHVL